MYLDPLGYLRQEIFEQGAMDVGQAALDAVVIKGEPLVVDT